MRQRERVLQSAGVFCYIRLALALPTSPVDTELAHQPLDRAPGDVAVAVRVLTMDRAPQFPHAATRIVGLKDVFDGDERFKITISPV